MNKIDQKTVYTIKALCADMIQKANSGHPGLPLGAAGFTHVLWSQVLNHDAKHPEWVNRDRFILSAGHGSSMLYSLLHLYGYGLTMDDLKQFRQLGSLSSRIWTYSRCRCHYRSTRTGLRHGCWYGNGSGSFSHCI